MNADGTPRQRRLLTDIADPRPTNAVLSFPPERLTRLDRIVLIGLAASFLMFSGIVLARSALLNRRFGDWNVYTRAAWAIRSGGDPYQMTDDNGFHYLYPPTFAILLAPLADAPAGVPRDGLLPYSATIICWYFVNLVCLVLAAHWLASALEEQFPRWSSPSWHGSRGWWGLRLWPFLSCLPTIGHTLIRGQVGILLLLFLSGMIAAAVRRRSWQAGGWLACAICLKVIPALLVFYPLFRRDTKFLGGCAAGLLVGLVIVPAAVRGPQQTWRDYERWNEVMVSPALQQGTDTSRAKEVLNVTATDSQSFLAMIHNTVFLDRSTRPSKADNATRLAAWTATGLLLLALFAAVRRSSRSDKVAEIIIWGVLIEVMLMASPVCHLHYFCLSVPVMVGLFGAAWRGGDRLRIGKPLSVLIAVNLAANIVPHFHGMEVWRDVGVAGYAAVVLIAVGVTVLWYREAPAVETARIEHRLRAAA
ncbi:MAG TPA: glycosyltransferase family 87 protein [Pirellulales bacterium]|nr:glycosyltransferase family 87 protein [Pirellulales bacterium]